VIGGVMRNIVQELSPISPQSQCFLKSFKHGGSPTFRRRGSMNQPSQTLLPHPLPTTPGGLVESYLPIEKASRHGSARKGFSRLSLPSPHFMNIAILLHRLCHLRPRIHFQLQRVQDILHRAVLWKIQLHIASVHWHYRRPVRPSPRGHRSLATTTAFTYPWPSSTRTASSCGCSANETRPFSSSPSSK